MSTQSDRTKIAIINAHNRDTMSETLNALEAHAVMLAARLDAVLELAADDDIGYADIRAIVEGES